MLKKLALPLLILAAIGGGIAYYLYNKKMPSMAAQKSEVAVSAADLYQEFQADETAATAKYLGKIVTVQGAVLESSTLDDGTPKVLLDTGSDFSISCEFDPNTKHERSSFPAGEKLTIKGECAGFNFDVQLARCVVVAH
ncbi:MAG: hypothetical protein JNK89_05610 [Saprospiraceae bacterium]|nr:hypothetical protein [Saprospiraceae bacterium]